MKLSTFRLLERSTLIATGFALGGVGGLAALTGNLVLLAVFVVAALTWLPTIGPYLIDLNPVDRSALAPWVEVSRRRVEYAYVDGSYFPAGEGGLSSPVVGRGKAERETPPSQGKRDRGTSPRLDRRSEFAEECLALADAELSEQAGDWERHARDDQLKA